MRIADLLSLLLATIENADSSYATFLKPATRNPKSAI